MKKIILVGVVAFAVGVIISPVAGMAISSTRNLILGMAPDEAILVLADKIDEESDRNDQQEQKINEQNETIVRQERIRICENTQKECLEKINSLEKRIGWKQESIESLKNNDIPQRAKDLKICEDSHSGCSDLENRLKETQEDLKKAEANLLRLKNELAGLINGECKDYQNPCE